VTLTNVPQSVRRLITARPLQFCPNCVSSSENSRPEAKVIIEAWRRYYNTERPHSSLAYKPLAPPSAQAMAEKPIMH